MLISSLTQRVCLITCNLHRIYLVSPFTLGWLLITAQGWGSLLAETSQDLPIIQAQPDDNVTVRWAVRSNNKSEGFVFVNNYQRLSAQESKSGVRLHIQTLNGSGAFLLE